LARPGKSFSSAAVDLLFVFLCADVAARQQQQQQEKLFSLHQYNNRGGWGNWISCNAGSCGTASLNALLLAAMQPLTPDTQGVAVPCLQFCASRRIVSSLEAGGSRRSGGNVLLGACPGMESADMLVQFSNYEN
jgi:hypothetical protein